MSASELNSQTPFNKVSWRTFNSVLHVFLGPCFPHIYKPNCVSRDEKLQYTKFNCEAANNNNVIGDFSPPKAI